MSSISLIKKIREAYRRGDNIMELLRETNDGQNEWQSIMISYDFQAGSYTRLAAENEEFIDRYTDALAEVWSELGQWHSVMEVGVGEATNMIPLMAKIDPDHTREVLGFDISWSRCRYALDNANNTGRAARIFVANLFEIPLPSDSIDIVYTSHSLEPNGGQEAAAIAELCRVARKYVILLEPNYEAASLEGKVRMDRHGYVRDLGRHARDQGFEIIEERPFEISINPLNPTGLTIIRVANDTISNPDFVCPVTRSHLKHYGGTYFSPESGLIYPIIDTLPCLVETSATLGLHFETFNQC